MIKKELMYILKSEIRLYIILSLNEYPKSPKELSSKQFYISHISNNLKDLIEKEYVICITPDLRKNKKIDIEIIRNSIFIVIDAGEVVGKYKRLFERIQNNKIIIFHGNIKAFFSINIYIN